MAKNILYTGYLEFKNWGVSLRKAKHKALISMKTYEKIQKKLNSNHQSIANKIQENSERSDISEDFPLRGFLYCEESKYMLSASWSRGRTTRVPYYTYPRKSPMYGKSINREVYIKILITFKTLTPKEDVMNCFEKIFLDLSQK
ncbi:MAG: hypothetical protein Q9M97_06775 [Candidatus Gracilibacteria bacterium]|nr:hypothetical protein [Candidatus Gracilibacteria bacterium]